jgi:hypothetical protein
MSDAGLNGSKDEILRRLDELEEITKGRPPENPGVIQRLASLESSDRHRDREEGKVLIAIEKLRQLHLLQSEFFNEQFLGIRGQLVDLYESVLDLKKKPKIRRKK